MVTVDGMCFGIELMNLFFYLFFLYFKLDLRLKICLRSVLIWSLTSLIFGLCVRVSVHRYMVSHFETGRSVARKKGMNHFRFRKSWLKYFQ